PTPSPSPEPTPAHTTADVTQPSPTQPSPTQPGTEHHLPTPHDSPLHDVHSHRSDEGSLKLNELTDLVTKLFDRIGALEDELKKTKNTYSSAYTKLILRVKKLKARVKIGKARRQARVVLLDYEDLENDSSKQGRKLSDADGQEKASTKTELFIQEVTPTEVIQTQEGSEKVSDEVSTAGAKQGTASEEVPIVSTAEVNLSTAGGTVTYTRRSAEKRSRQDKGKAIMIESEPKKKSKKRLSYVEAIRLEEQMNEEQRAQIARDEEIARQWDEEERKRAMAEAKSTKKIDWNDPSVIRYHSLKMKPKTVAQARRNMIKYLKNQGNYKISDFKGMSYNDIRPIFEKVWDFNQNIEPMDAEHGSGKQKSPEKSPEKIVEEDVDTQEEMKEVVKEPGAKRKKSIPRKSTRKRQKMEEDAEKEELKGFLDIIPREEVPIEVESISTKFPIVDWKTCVLTETFMYYQVFRGDGSSKNYKILSEMLEDFDRLDVEELYRLVKERYSASRPEGFDLMLWGDLHTLFEPDEDDEIWKDQHEYKLLSWRLYDFCGIHILLMENGLAIHMLTEKKYPLSQEMISKMLKKKLEVDHESSQAIELLRFIRSQVLPSVFTETLYTECPWLYLIHNRGTKHKVCLKKVSGTNNYALFSNEWKEFLHESKYIRVSTFYFIHQGVDEYYVTAYHNGGFECNGYDLVRVGNKQKRCLVTMGDMKESPVLPYQFLVNLEHNRVGVMVSGIRVSTVIQRIVDLLDDRRGHMFSGQGWHILAQVKNLEVGTKLIFTNLLNNIVSMLPFDDSGIALRVENVSRMLLNQQRSFVKSPADKDKRMEHECDWVDHEEQHDNEERFLFSPILAYTIPFWFVENNNLKSYHNPLLRYEQTLFYVDVDMEPHAERADNNNHMNIKTNWRDIVHECDFKTNKRVRLKLIYNDVVDILETKDQLDPVKIPLFDIC
ncbi:hypothetical protein Tco_0951830, partial [Tanacetum coccineum]